MLTSSNCWGHNWTGCWEIVDSKISVRNSVLWGLSWQSSSCPCHPTPHFVTVFSYSFLFFFLFSVPASPTPLSFCFSPFLFCLLSTMEWNWWLCTEASETTNQKKPFLLKVCFLKYFVIVMENLLRHLETFLVVTSYEEEWCSSHIADIKMLLNILQCPRQVTARLKYVAQDVRQAEFG